MLREEEESCGSCQLELEGWLGVVVASPDGPER